MYFNTQEEIITRIGKSLEKSLILRKKVIKILSGIVIGIILVNNSVKDSRKFKRRFLQWKRRK